MLISDLRPDCEYCRYFRYMVLVNLKKTVRTDAKIWFAQDANDCSTRTETCCHKNMLGLGQKLLETGYLDHLCLVSKLCCFGLGNVVFRGWLGNNMPGSGHELTETGYLDHLCRVSKSWCFGLVNVVFGGWLGDCQNVIFGNAMKVVWCNNLLGLGNESM